jgi:hypothetical protein
MHLRPRCVGLLVYLRFRRRDPTTIVLLETLCQAHQKRVAGTLSVTWHLWSNCFRNYDVSNSIGPKDIRNPISVNINGVLTRTCAASRKILLFAAITRQHGLRIIRSCLGCLKDNANNSHLNETARHHFLGPDATRERQKVFVLRGALLRRWPDAAFPCHETISRCCECGDPTLASQNAMAGACGLGMLHASSLVRLAEATCRCTCTCTCRCRREVDTAQSVAL